MNFLTIAFTRIKRLAPPEPLPEIVEPPRAAWLAGLGYGACLGATIGIGMTVLFLQAIGRLQ